MAFSFPFFLASSIRGIEEGVFIVLLLFIFFIDYFGNFIILKFSIIFLLVPLFLLLLKFYLLRLRQQKLTVDKKIFTYSNFMLPRVFSFLCQEFISDSIFFLLEFTPFLISMKPFLDFCHVFDFADQVFLFNVFIPLFIISSINFLLFLKKHLNLIHMFFLHGLRLRIQFIPFLLFSFDPHINILSILLYLCLD